MIKAPTINTREKQKLFLSGYTHISIQRAGILTYPTPKFGACFQVDEDLCLLFPFINSRVESALYYENPERIQIIEKGIQCTLYSHEIIAAAFKDRDHALEFSEHLLIFLNDIYTKRDSIQPNYHTSTPLSVLDVYRILPKTNCGECGWPGCLAFAGALSRGKSTTDQCPDFPQPIVKQAVYPIVDKGGRITGTLELPLPKQEKPRTEKQRRLTALLTKREIQILRLIVQGFTNPKISEQLFISPHTVKTHVVHIYEKLKVNDRTQAAVLATKHQLL
jgi:DNA-binding CsgD family transcriptional regulator/ArsR family metal-binding transcriptional regulator